MKIKLFVTTLVLVLASTMTLPVFAGAPQTPADCQRIFAGDDAAIQACIDRLGQ